MTNKLQIVEVNADNGQHGEDRVGILPAPAPDALPNAVEPPADNCKPTLQLRFEPWQDDLAAKIDEVTRGYVDTVLRVGELVDTWSKRVDGKWGDGVVGQIATHPLVHCTRQWLYRCWGVYKCIQEHGDDLKRFDLPTGVLIQLSRITQKKGPIAGTDKKILLLKCAEEAHVHGWTVDRASQSVTERLRHRDPPTINDRFVRAGKFVDRATEAVNLMHQELTSSHPHLPSALVAGQLHRKLNSLLHAGVAILSSLSAVESANESRDGQLAAEYERFGGQLTAFAKSLQDRAAKSTANKSMPTLEQSVN